ncbi:MAG: PA14 domain-containing protein, partial [Bacteroidia bacterium]
MRFNLHKIWMHCSGHNAIIFQQKRSFLFSVFLIVNLLFTESIVAQNNLVPFTFTLSKASTTSAGIFRKDSTLVRTLWNNVKYPAGTHTAHWDRKDDEGFLVNDSFFDVRVVSSNMTYTWEGSVGNSSDSMVGISKHRYYTRPNSMAISGNTAYYTVGYTEGITSAYKLNLSSPQNKIGILYNTNHDVDQEGSFTATDGTIVYWAGYDPFDVNVTFVYGTSVANDQEVNFSSGSSVGMTFGRTYNAAIDLYTNNAASRISGLAVQKLGSYLFVAHAQLNELHVLNKSTGALVQTISVTTPRQLCVDMNDNLWMISGTNSVQKYTVNTNGTLSSPILSIANLVEPLNLAVSPNNYLIVVTDGGSSQQIKAFNNANANSVWTFGQAGGYSSDATVTNDKFFFSHAPTEIKGSFIAFQADSSFWVGDPGNERILHFSSNRTFIERIMSLPHSYSVQADINNPTRVFNEYLEFKIDYSKPLDPNNGSWTLVKNWRYGVPATYYQDYKADILRNVITLSNGRTYATIEDLSVQDWRTPEIVELPASGNLRFTGIQLEPFENFIIDPDGTIRTLVADSKIGSNGVWTVRTLNGFDNNNNPKWSNPSNYATSPKVTLDDPFCDGPSYPAKTKSDLLIVFNPWEQDANGKGHGYHLGAIKKGSNKWLWKTSKATDLSYQGPFPTDGAFDLGNNVEYPGGHVYAIENNIFWNYHGEFWKNSQTNIWNHYHENGLMVSQFGITSIEGENMYEQAFPMGAGNVYSSVFVKVGDDYYLYHNDESVHAGIHRWKISGFNSIKVQTIPIKISSLKTGQLKGYFYEGKNLDNSYPFFCKNFKEIKLETVPKEVKDPNNYSVRWLGKLRNPKTLNTQMYLKGNGGMRLWINDELKIDVWTNKSENIFKSDTIEIEAYKSYAIKVESNGGQIELGWEYEGVDKLLESEFLFNNELDSISEWLNLLDGLPYKTSLEDNLYGWRRFPEIDDTAGGITK